jgi:hypothetical protein
VFSRRAADRAAPVRVARLLVVFQAENSFGNGAILRARPALLVVCSNGQDRGKVLRIPATGVAHEYT